jgi:tetratricopeptide (TPR) repeat protein
VYALGAVLYELLTGRPPFQAPTTHETLLQVIGAEPAPPRRLQPGVPRDLETICLKCLEKDPQRRYATAAELAADLGRWRRGEPVLARPPSLGYLLGKQLRRHRVPVTVAAAVLLAAVIGVTTAFVQINNARNDAENSLREADRLGRSVSGLEKLKEELQGQVKEAKGDLEKTRAEGREQLSALARTYFDLSDTEFQRGRVDESLSFRLRAYEKAPKDDPLRRSCLFLLGGQRRSQGRVLAHEGAAVAAAFSPDGRTVLTGSLDHTARLWEAATGKLLAVLHHEGQVRAVAFSPDGRVALTGSSDSAARLWEMVRPAPDDPVRLSAWVRVRTRKGFDANGALRALTEEEWQEAARELETHGGDWEKPGDARSWRLVEGGAAEAAHEWYGAAFHLRRLLAVDPGNAEYRERLGDALYHDGRFAEAADQLTVAIRDYGQGGTLSMRLLLALAQNGPRTCATNLRFICTPPPQRDCSPLRSGVRYSSLPPSFSPTYPHAGHPRTQS